MELVDLQVGLIAAMILVPIWLFRQERNAFLRLFRRWGLRVATPEDEIKAIRASDLVPDVEVLGARARPVPGGGLWLEVDIMARNRLAKKAVVKLGLLDPAGTAYPVPPGKRWARFADDVEALGGEIESSFATVSEMRWEELGLEIPQDALPGKRVPDQIQLRVEVWIDGRKEATTRRDLLPNEPVAE